MEKEHIQLLARLDERTAHILKTSDDTFELAKATNGRVTKLETEHAVIKGQAKVIWGILVFIAGLVGFLVKHYFFA